MIKNERVDAENAWSPAVNTISIAAGVKLTCWSRDCTVERITALEGHGTIMLCNQERGRVDVVWTSLVLALPFALHRWRAQFFVFSGE